MTELAEELHALCQPLTALQCRLEIAQMKSEEDGWVPDARETVALWDECVRECGRLNDHVATMRRAIVRARAGEKGRDV